MNIKKMDPTQVYQASQVLSASFFNYPMFTFYFPNPSIRTRYLSWYFRNVINSAMSYGEVYSTSDMSGVVFYLPPEHSKLSIWEFVQNGFILTPLIMGFKNYFRSMECEAYVEKLRERIMEGKPHYYLWGLAVDPSKKRVGIGSKLLRFILNIADRAGKPVYLETHASENVGYYQKYDFDLVETARIPKYDLAVYCMVREAAI